MTLPSFVGIGAQKCATTWLAEVIRNHPGLFMAADKEQDFWSNHYHMGYSWYEAAFDGAGSLPAGEISPSYLVNYEAPARLAAKVPDCKLILALRDPIDRAFSNHLHQLRKGDYKRSDISFEAGLADNPMYLEQSRYGRHLARWRDYFAPEQFFVAFQEDITRDPLAEASRLYRFLGVDPDWRGDILNERTHENVGYKNQALRDGLRRMARAAESVGLGKLAKAAKTAPVIGALYQSNRQDFRAMLPKPGLDERRALALDLEADMRQLCRLLNRPELPWPSWHALADG